jgi:hypothetical protein
MKIQLVTGNEPHDVEQLHRMQIDLIRVLQAALASPTKVAEDGFETLNVIELFADKIYELTSEASQKDQSKTIN